MEKVNLKDIQNQVIVGIYKLDFPNNKSYIGQSRNIYKRVSEHNQRAKLGQHGNRDIQICEQAIAKYGAIEHFIILERVSDTTLLDDRESYWIQYYHTNDKDKGYNLTAGGDASNKSGCNHTNAALNEQQLSEIVDLLLNHTELSYIDIANQYNVGKYIIERISTGQSYINPDLHYPLRKFNHDASKKDEITDYFKSEEELLNLKEDLAYDWTLSIEQDIPKKYNIPLGIVRDINQGRKFSNIGNYTYPIRNKNIRNPFNFSRQDILNILNLLKNSDMTMQEIGNIYNISRSTVRRINNGQTYIIKDFSYPARITQ